MFYGNRLSYNFFYFKVRNGVSNLGQKYKIFYSNEKIRKWGLTCLRKMYMEPQNLKADCEHYTPGKTILGKISPKNLSGSPGIQNSLPFLFC